MDYNYLKPDFEIKVTDEKGVDISPDMIGLFFEDINYSADGGLYAEMVENRSFEATVCVGENGEYERRPSYAWSVASGGVRFDGAKPLNENNTHYATLFGGEYGAELINKAYEGVYLEKGKEYNCSIWARKNSYDGEIIFNVKKGGEYYLKGVLEIEPSSVRADGWAKYSICALALETVERAEFSVSFPTLKADKSVDIDMVSQIPSDAVFGVFRRDLAEMLKELKPKFLRFPGGCIVEGFNLENRYRWKNSVGEPHERVQNLSRWGMVKSGRGYEDYNQTLGIGFYEYFLLCEYLGCKPIPVLNAGMACQYNTKEVVPLYSEDGRTVSDEFLEYVEDALDLIEFANGETDTHWGGLRAKMGREKPFNLEMLGIGNEQWKEINSETGEDNLWFERYEIFERAIHEKYPNIKLIGSAGPDVKTFKYGEAWRWLHIKTYENPDFVYAVDEHYYNEPNWFFANDNFYDKYSREVKIFAGEYASRDCFHSNDLWTALSEAAFMTGLERNSDIVCMASYAPVLARINYNQWRTNMIWFDHKSVYGTPDYYVQKMYSSNMGDITLKSTAAENCGGEKYYHSVSYDTSNGDIIIKAVNKYKESRRVNITISESFKVCGAAKVIILCGGDAFDKNSVAEPYKISDFETVINGVSNDFEYEAPGLSFCIIRVRAERVLV